jgi:hypothetical protein
MNKKNEKSPHILNTSSNLLGFCFIVLTSLNVMKVKDETIIDTLTTIAIIIFVTSSILSFMSMKLSDKLSERLESVADFVFMSGLILLFVTTMLISFDLIK